MQKLSSKLSESYNVLFFYALIFLGLVMPLSFAQQDISERDVALIREVNNLQKNLGSRIWQTWVVDKIPFLYKTKMQDFLFDHPNPPEDFNAVFSPNLNKLVWTRVNRDTNAYQATMDINEYLTVVMTEPDSFYDPSLWVLKTTHEIFHLYQGYYRPTQPFQEKYAGTNELTFNFTFTDEKVSAAGQIEAVYLFSMLRKENWTRSDTLDIKRYLKNMNSIMKYVFPDTLQYNYKKLIEWKEGVASYTEREIANLASQSIFYKPSKDFQIQFPNCSYSNTFHNKYGENNIFNPLRFVYEGIKNKMVFYFIGLGKAYLLDKLDPDWKKKYLKFDLDALITNSRIQPQCPID